MKRLNEKDFEIMKWSLTGEQLNEIREKGMITLNKQQMIETLNKEIKGTKEMQIEVEKNIDKTDDAMVKDMMNKCLEGGTLRINEMQELLNKLENDNEDYLQGFMKGDRG